VPAVGADEGVVLSVGVPVAVELRLGEGAAEIVGEGEADVGEATGSLEPPEQPASATTAIRAQSGPMVRTRRA
jgi:hypothetical protein